MADAHRSESRKGSIGTLLSTLLLLTVGCASTAGNRGESTTTTSGPTSSIRPDESRVLGVLANPEDNFAGAIAAPASVKAGERFVVTVTTTGSGCDRAGDVGVLLGERHATLMVYDFTYANRPDVVCAMMLKTLKHDVPLTFSQTGDAVIRVWGRRQNQNSPPYGEPYVIEHRIVVR